MSRRSAQDPGANPIEMPLQESDQSSCASRAALASRRRNYPAARAVAMGVRARAIADEAQLRLNAGIRKSSYSLGLLHADDTGAGIVVLEDVAVSCKGLLAYLA